MVKLIVCDLDGTLLPGGQKEISPEIISLIKFANEKGVTFAVASGRSYHELKGFFDGYGPELVFIPSDGAAVVYKEETRFKKPLQNFAVNAMIGPVLQADSMTAVLSGKYISYIISKDKAFVSECFEKMRGHLMEISDFAEITEDIWKVSFFGEPKTTFSDKILSGSFSSLTRLIYKNNGWTEFISASAGKEKALECIMKNLKVKPHELVVLGDGMNDVEILKLTPNSYAVSGGNPEAISAAKFETSNVAQTLNEILRKDVI